MTGGLIMKKIISFVPILVLLALLTGCSKNLYFGTATAVGLDVSGTSTIPNKVSFAFSRTEVAVVPEDSSGNAHSVFASLESDWTWFHGFIIKQRFATGQAADIVSLKSEPDSNPTSSQTNNIRPSKKPLLFTTGTKLGIEIDFGQTSGAPASLLVGYRRAEMTLMSDVAGVEKLDPVFADISIISADQSSPPTPGFSQIGGVKINQRFATGNAAVNAASNGEAREKLRKAVLGSPTQAMLNTKERFDKEGNIQNEFSKMDDPQKEIYLKTLNVIAGKTSPNLITSANLQNELKNLNDTQIQKAVEQIKPIKP
jgi:hypothetical protein